MKRWILFLIVALPAFAGREFVATSSQLMVINTDSVSIPLTISVSLRRPDNVGRVAVALNSSTSSVERVQVFWDGAVSNVWSISGVEHGGTGLSTYGTSNAVGSITHVAGVWTSTTSRAVFVNGGNKRSTSSANTADGFNQIVIGCRKNTTFGAFWDGFIAEVAVWSAALSDHEIAQLAAGLTPHAIRPGARVAYLPLWGASTPEVELWNGYTVLHTNAPAGANGLHPSIYR